MQGIIEFITDVGEDSELAQRFASIISKRCTQQQLLDFFSQNNYPDVNAEDVAKLLSHKERIRSDFRLPENVDY